MPASFLCVRGVVGIRRRDSASRPMGFVDSNLRLVGGYPRALAWAWCVVARPIACVDSVDRFVGW